jgi:hypothetical protein
VVSLQLTGDAGVTYRLEGSTNLTTWFSVGSGPAVAGLLTLTHNGPAQWPWVCYRGVQTSPQQTYLTVGIEADTNLVAEAVLLPGEPRSVRLETPSGVVFTLAAPTNALVDATPVTMTLVTNLTGIPAPGGFLAAVQLEPAGWLFQAPLFLRIDFPTNLPSSPIGRSVRCC